MRLIDSHEAATHVTTGSVWCLIVESSTPFEGYDMEELGRFASHQCLSFHERELSVVERGVVVRGIMFP
ncbi:hypothetical protein ABZT48_40140 [Streptomyces avermitilis]|uniref:hypothetical protein n=1 Tax=Streptomyces avermitilis TaxID=33903 RepID=UPI0033B9860F